jgi:hypothetical protein
MTQFLVADGRDNLQTLRIPVNIIKKKSRPGQPSAGGPPSWVFGGCFQILTIETPCYEI